ncbi:unnamed protein product, partial [Symbiodinium microadriaticum]
MQIVGKPTVTEDSQPLSVVAQEKKPQFNVKDLPKVAGEIVGGFVRKFLNKQQLAPEEEKCLQEGSVDLAKDILLVASHTVMLTQELLGKHQDLSNLGDFVTMTTSAPSQEFLKQNGLFAERRLADDILMDTSKVIIELGVSLQKVSALGHQVSHGCLKEDGVKALEIAASHSINATYIGHRLLLDGWDVCHLLADAAKRWDDSDRKGFGEEMGMVFRTLLFNPTGRTWAASGDWEDGMPDEATLLNMSSAFLAAFFGPGLELEFRPLWKNKVEDEFKIDLHRCFGLNADLLEKAWASIASIFKNQLEMKRDATHAERAEAKKRLQDTLSYDLMQIPSALAKCDLGRDKQKILEDAYFSASMNDALSMSLVGPDEPRHGIDITEQVKRALEKNSWKKDGGIAFGKALGKLCQELALWAFPRKYAVDHFGRLYLRSEALAPFVLAWPPLAFVAVLPFLCRRFSSAAPQAEPALLANEDTGSDRTTFRAILKGRAKDKTDTLLVDVAASGGGTRELEVSKAEVLRLNQPHRLATSGKHLLLEDGLKCDYSSPLMRAKLCEIALALDPVV